MLARSPLDGARLGRGLLDRYRGCLLGLACGDAVGAAAEFGERGSFEPVTGMRGGGPHELAPGQWTDDTSMALCLAHSLLARGGFDARDQMERYVAWWKHGALSSTGQCFDIGSTVRAALERYLATDEPFAGSTSTRSAGNGSLMRLAPIVLHYLPARTDVLHYAAQSSLTTHGAREAVECCKLFALQLACALDGASKHELTSPIALELVEPKVRALARAGYASKSREHVRGSGYCVESLEAALWCFHTTTSFESAVLAAANLGDDADTTAAITGQLAGAHYGAAAIPRAWLDCLSLRGEIDALAVALHAAATARSTPS